MLYEIRNYHFEPTKFEEYKTWARTLALPYIQKNLDLVGFWASTEDPSEVTGADMDALGSANITWILRWPDRDTRNLELPKAFSGEEWEEIFAQVPGGLGSYQRMEAKFTESLL